MFDIHAGIGLFDFRHASQNTDLLMQTKISVRMGDFIFYVAKWDKESDRYNYLLRNKKKMFFFHIQSCHDMLKFGHQNRCNQKQFCQFWSLLTYRLTSSDLNWSNSTNYHRVANLSTRTYHVQWSGSVPRQKKPQTSNQDSQRKRNSSSQFLQGRM
jgi:hypothetical protein